MEPFEKKYNNAIKKVEKMRKDIAELVKFVFEYKSMIYQEDNVLQKAFINSKIDYTLEEKCDASDYAETILPTSVTYGENEEEYKLHKIIEAAFIAGQKKGQKSIEQNYDNRIQYDSVKSGIEAFASTYSFNIESILFLQLTKEQKQLWRKELEQAVIAGGESGIELARDTRYKENRSIEWNEEDEKMIRFYESDYNNTIGDMSMKDVLDMRLKFKNWLINRLKSLRPVNQKWSDDDEILARFILRELEKVKEDSPEYSKHFERLIEWFTYRFKSLRPQPKHEQEEIVLYWEKGHPEPYKSVLILRHGNVVVEGEWNEKMGMWYQYGFQCHLKDNEVEGWMNKKSLLSGNFNPQPHWKPSKEQMDALEVACLECRDLAKTSIALNSLKSDLYLQKLL